MNYTDQTLCSDSVPPHPQPPPTGLVGGDYSRPSLPLLLPPAAGAAADLQQQQPHQQQQQQQPGRACSALHCLGVCRAIISRTSLAPDSKRWFYCILPPAAAVIGYAGGFSPPQKKLPANRQVRPPPRAQMTVSL